MFNSNKIILFLVGVLLVISFFQMGKIDSLENKINNQNSTLTHLYNRIDNITDSVNETMRAWKIENSWVRSSRYTLENIHNIKNIDVLVSWDLNELKKDEVVYLLVGKINSDKSTTWEKIEVSPKSELYYEETLKLELDGSYKFQIVGDDNGYKRSSNLNTFYIGDRIKERVRIHGDINKRSNDDSIFVVVDIFAMPIIKMFELREMTEGMEEKFDIESAICEIKLDGEIVKSIDLLKDGEVDGRKDRYYDEFKINYSNTFKDEKYNEGKLEMIIKVKDKFGLEYTHKTIR